MNRLRHYLRSNRGFILFLLAFGLFRTAVADWNPIPSGSMRPNLLEGDVVLINRLAFDLKVPLSDIVILPLGEPKRGDIVTFSSPRDGTRLIKRIVALPGDIVAMRGQRLAINGHVANYEAAEAVVEPAAEGGSRPGVRVTEDTGQGQRRIQWLEGAAAYGNFGPVVVPQGHYLMLGDNRDNSADSRYFGFVPRKLLIGRAERILVSADILDDWLPRLGRFGKRLL